MKTKLPSLRKLKRLAKEREQPRLNYTCCSLDNLVDEVKSEYFPDLQCDIEIHFMWHDTLAFIAHLKDRNKAQIVIHIVLNHTNTPPEVFRFIIKHELLHLVIPAREIKGKIKQHPPEFWRREEEISPESELVWNWLWENIWVCLKRRPRLERTDVNHEWQKCCGRTPFSLEYCMEEMKDFEAYKNAIEATL